MTKRDRTDSESSEPGTKISEREHKHMHWHEVLIDAAIFTAGALVGIRLLNYFGR